MNDTSAGSAIPAPAPAAIAPGDCRAGFAQPNPKPQIAIIIDELLPSDAVGTAVVDTWRFLSGDTRWEVTILAGENHLDGVPARIVHGLAQMLLSREFLSADLLIYHYCFASAVCDALLIGNGRARQAVFFHGMTPPELVTPSSRSDAERSIVQLHNLGCADRLWPVSRTNADFLLEAGFNAAAIDIIPLCVDRPAIGSLRDKPAPPVELVFLGRIVPHKGVHELIEAIARVRRRDLPPFRLQIGGVVEPHAQAYFDALNRAVAEHRLGDIVKFVGLLDADRRDRLLQHAHILPIPSYHEGFCKPVIEALRAGCVPVGYASHNLRFIADGLGRMVAPGDVAALADALADAVADAAAAVRDPHARLRLDRGSLTIAEFTEAAAAHVDQFRAERVAAAMRNHVARTLTRARYSGRTASRMSAIEK